MTATETLSWAVGHQKNVIYSAAAAAVVLSLALGIWLYSREREQAAGAALAQALQTYQAPVGAQAEQTPGAKSFPTSVERARAAKAEFQKVAKEYGRTNGGKLAAYFVGLTERDLNDTAAAERDLKAAAEARNPDVAAMAKFALAALYREMGKPTDAVKLYKELADKPTNTVAKSTAELEMADSYAAMNQATEARRIYEQIGKDQPNSAAAELAAARQAALKQ